jgi:hypothetical protein
LFLLVNLAVSTKIVLFLDIAPLLFILTVFRGIILCVNNLPATLNLIPESAEGIKPLFIANSFVFVFVFFYWFSYKFFNYSS